ncbi:MAG: cell envelope integrity protein TolA [Candidatus Micrarchaeaceae archaeon]
MPVDINDILIFKERGMTAPKRQPESEAAQQKQQGQRLRAETASTKPDEEVEAARLIEEQVKERLERQEEEYGAQVEGNIGEIRPTAGKVTASPFSVIAGAFLLADAALLGFFGYPQYALTLSQLKSLGFFGFLSSVNYTSGISLLNLVLMLGIGLCGLLMVARFGKTYIAAGSISVVLLVTASFEYLSSNAAYLAIVSVVTFLCIIAIAYSRMSAVTVAEEEGPEPEQIVWPSIETF